MSQQEIAEALGVSERTAHSYIESGRIPSVAVGKWKRVRREDFEKWLQAEEAAHKEFLSIEETADLLGVTPRTVHRFLKGYGGHPPILSGEQVGGRSEWRIRRADVLGLKAQREGKGATPSLEGETGQEEADEAG